MRETFWLLEKLGRVRLSDHFYFRQFLYSEIGAAFGIPNVPDDADLAIETGTRLCQEILEPLQRTFGPLVIRSGFRSARLNAFGAERRLKCASNEKTSLTTSGTTSTARVQGCGSLRCCTGVQCIRQWMAKARLAHPRHAALSSLDLLRSRQRFQSRLARKAEAGGLRAIPDAALVGSAVAKNTIMLAAALRRSDLCERFIYPSAY